MQRAQLGAAGAVGGDAVVGAQAEPALAHRELQLWSPGKLLTTSFSSSRNVSGTPGGTWSVSRLVGGGAAAASAALATSSAARLEGLDLLRDELGLALLLVVDAPADDHHAVGVDLVLVLARRRS